MRPYLVALLVALAAPTVAEAQETIGSTPSPVVYGSDDRLDRYQITDATLRDLGRDSIVAIVETNQLDFADATTSWPPFATGFRSLRDYIEMSLELPLCPAERFSEQPTIAGCSGTLIAPDVVLTAGHCFVSQADCDANSLVFDYFYSANGVPEPIDAGDVYSCRRILAREQTAAPHVDFALVQLDRVATGRHPVAVRRERSALAVGTELVVVGFGTGLPMKFDSGGMVTDSHAGVLDTFETNTDTFAGNSGAGIFDADGTLVGLLVTGQEDYVEDKGCITVNALPNTPGGESATYAFRAIDGLCEAHSGHSLCGKSSRCEASSAGESLRSPGAVGFVALSAVAVLVARRRTRAT